MSDKENKSKWSIRRKLAGIMLLTIFVSLSGMIFMATYFFRKDVENRVKENAIQVAISIGAKTKSDFTLIIEKINLMLSLSKKTPTSKIDSLNFEKVFFQNDKYFLMIGIFSKQDEIVTESEIVFNEEALIEFNLKKDLMVNIAKTNDNFSKAFSGNISVENISPELGITAFAISFPFKDRKDKCIIAILHSKKILETFEKKNGIIDSQLVNASGDIIAHFDDRKILKKMNIFESPVVKSMLTSRFDNGQIKYDDERGLSMIGSFRKIGLADAAIISTVEEDKALEEVFNIQRRNVYILIITLCLAFFVAYNFSVSISSPIINLLYATNEVQKGNFDFDIEPKYDDEVGELTSSFNQMRQGLKEREKAKEALSLFVNKDIAELAMKGELKLGGEAKDCVIFFSDIRNFTSMSEKMTPEEVLEFLNEYFNHMVNCVNMNDGTVDKFIGDAIMATWGIPKNSDHDAEDALNGALLMRFALRDFNARRIMHNKVPIFIGCGINSGNVIVGQIGSYEKLQYTVIGDEVNLASRLEALNKEFGTDILVSSNVFEKVKDKFKFIQLDKTKIKGKKGTQTVYAVLGRIDSPDTPNTIEELRQMIGFKWNKKDMSFLPLERKNIEG